MKEVGIGLFHAPHACMAAHFERCQLCRADMLAVVFPHMTLITGNTHMGQFLLDGEDGPFVSLFKTTSRAFV